MEGLRHCATKIMEIENQRLWHDLIPFFCYKCKKNTALEKDFFFNFFFNLAYPLQEVLHWRIFRRSWKNIIITMLLCVLSKFL